jgi:ATP-binding cassette subfamily B protein
VSRRSGALVSFGRAVGLVMSAGRTAFLGTVAMFATSGLGMVVLLLIGNSLLRELRHSGHPTMHVWWLLVGAVVVAGVVSFANSAGVGLHRLLAEETMRYCSDVMLRVGSSAGLREFESPEFHDMLQRARSNSTAALQIAVAVPQVISAAISAVGVTIGLAVISPWLVPITLISCLPLWFVGRANSDEMYSFSFGNTPQDRARYNIEHIVLGRATAPEVRAFRLADFLHERWTALYAERLADIHRLVRRFVRRAALGSAISALILCGVLALVLLLVRHGELQIQAAATASVAILLLANRSQAAVTSLAQMMEQKLYVDEFVELRKRPVHPQSPVAVRPFTTLTVDDISFTYPAADRKALDGISTSIGTGEVVAIVGPNGSGKTTLAKLLAGLYHPSTGQIRWDDTPIDQLASDGGLSEVGVVFQDFARYWFSAADNIAIGDVARSADRDAIADAAHEAGAVEFIDRLPTGFDTPLTVEVDGGADLSGGQWQRIAIARVLFRNASFIILDEPTAALDAEAEAALFGTIQEMRAGRTVVLISHRFSTVRTADRILVVHEGRLVEEGSHADLMALGGRYSRMYQLQSSAYVG